jgi:hypothetical protein
MPLATVAALQHKLAEAQLDAARAKQANLFRRLCLLWLTSQCLVDVGLQRSGLAAPPKKRPTSADSDAPFVASLPRVHAGTLRRPDTYNDALGGSDSRLLSL